MMYFMLSVAHDEDLKNNPFYDELSDLGTEFASFDHLSINEITDEDITYLEKFTDKIQEKIASSKII